MKQYFILIVFCLICHALSIPLHAQNYAAQAQEIREEVWGWDIPAFEKYDIPEAYAHESAIIIASHRRVGATGKKGSAFMMALAAQGGGKMFYSDATRIMVKINDKAALEVYSSLSFKEKTRTYMDLFQTFVGVRIIKPDGRKIEVNVDNDAVAITEGRREKDAYKKLAIPDLQMGDILDYFFYEMYTLQSQHITDQAITFFSVDYPTLYCSAQCEFGKNVTIEYRSINGAPGFSQHTNESGNTILKAETNSILHLRDFKNTPWLSAYRELPMIRFSVLQNASQVAYKPKSARPTGIHKNVPVDSIISDAMCYLAEVKHKFRLEQMANYSKIKEAILHYKTRVPQVDRLDLATYIATLYEFYWQAYENPFFNARSYVIGLKELFDEQGIESRFGFLSNNMGPRREELFDSDDVDIIIIANGGEQLFSPRPAWWSAGEIPGRYEGNTATTLHVLKYRKPLNTQPAFITGVKGEFLIPTSSPEQNKEHTLLFATFSENDPQTLSIERVTLQTREVKRERSLPIVLYEDIDRETRQYLHIDRTYIQELEEKRSSRQHIEKLLALFETQREKQSDKVKEEIKLFHNLEPKELVGFSIQRFGATPTQPELEYTTEYTLEGLVKRAGDNLIFEVGKLMGAQWVPTEENRNRNVDAYLPSARSFENEITIRVPEGYHLRLPESFDVEVENKYGKFSTTSVIKENLLIIKTTKIYKESFIPKNEFHQLLAVIDSANEFYAKSVVLTKE